MRQIAAPQTLASSGPQRPLGSCSCRLKSGLGGLARTGRPRQGQTPLTCAPHTLTAPPPPPRPRSVMLVGLGGNNGTTVAAGILANKQ
jgi:hypothetical protein